MKKMFLITTNTYSEVVKTKGFIGATIFLILVIGVIINADKIINIVTNTFTDTEQTIDIAIYDSTGTIEVDNHLPNQHNPFNFHIVEEQEHSNINKLINGNNWSGLVNITNSNNNLIFEIHKTAIMNQEHVDILKDILNNMQLSDQLANIGLDINESNNLVFSPNIGFQEIDLDSGVNPQTSLIIFLNTGLLCLFIYTYGYIVAYQIAIEKSTRVMEILLSSVTPVQHMFGKILGIALVGITQISIIMLSYWTLFMISNKENILRSININGLGLNLLVYTIIFFILGYLLYASIFAMIGSLVNRLEEVNQFTTPLSYILFFCFILTLYGQESPDHQIISIASFIPFFTPVIMPLRIGLVEPSVFEIQISIGIMILTIVIIALITSRIYKGGVLTYNPTGKFMKSISDALLVSKK